MLSRPRMCDGGVAICNRSVGPSWSARPQWPTAAANEAWVWRTALGRPVVPELKTKTASPAGGTGPTGSICGGIGSSRLSMGISSASSGWSPTAYVAP
jgi:hypothetical protein